MNSLPYGSSRELDVYDIVAIVLSVLVPGLGHVMLGQTAKGVLILALVVASCGVGYLVSALIALDAYCVARARKVRQVSDWELFPE
jgi:TM2 domain-containing membrane protein YozV